MVDIETLEMMLMECEEKMNKTLDVLHADVLQIRAGRANPHILDKVLVDYYGTPTPINQVGNISVTDARCLVISPWDVSMLKVIEKQLLAENLGITPANDGKVIRLVFPQLTEERRKALVKDVAKMAEETKVAIRSIRRDANDKVKAMKKDSEMTADEAKQSDKLIQDLTDKYIKEIDSITAAKTKEIMEI